MLLQPAHHAPSSIQPPGAASGQQDGVHLVYQVGGVQQVGLARARRGTTHIHTCHGPVAGNHHRAAGRSACVGEMADFYAQDVGNGVAVALGMGHGIGLSMACLQARLVPGAHHPHRWRLQTNQVELFRVARNQA